MARSSSRGRRILVFISSLVHLLRGAVLLASSHSSHIIIRRSTRKHKGLSALTALQAPTVSGMRPRNTTGGGILGLALIILCELTTVDALLSTLLPSSQPVFAERPTRPHYVEPHDAEGDSWGSHVLTVPILCSFPVCRHTCPESFGLAGPSRSGTGWEERGGPRFPLRLASVSSSRIRHAVVWTLWHRKNGCTSSA